MLGRTCESKSVYFGFSVVPLFRSSLHCIRHSHSQESIFDSEHSTQWTQVRMRGITKEPKHTDLLSHIRCIDSLLFETGTFEQSFYYVYFILLPLMVSKNWKKLLIFLYSSCSRKNSRIKSKKKRNATQKWLKSIVGSIELKRENGYGRLNDNFTGQYFMLWMNIYPYWVNCNRLRTSP